MESKIWNLIDGEIKEAKEDSSISLENPNTNEKLGNGYTTDEADLQTALKAAWRVYDCESYGEKDPRERAAYVDAMADYLETKTEEIAHTESTFTGVPISQTRILATIVPLAFRAAAQQARKQEIEDTYPGPVSDVRILRRAWGPALCLTPWNSPTPLAAHKVASALAAGAPVILKPSEVVPQGPQLLLKAAAQANLPRGLMQLVNGGPKVGGYLVKNDHIRSISFTGGLHAGQQIGIEAAKKVCPIQLELGGHNPLVVFEGADLHQVAQDLVLGLTTINGQWCRAVGKLVVQKKLWPQLKPLILEAMSQIVLGDAREETTTMGPIVHSKQANLIRDQITSHCNTGAKQIPLVEHEGRHSGFIPPTLLENLELANDKEEIFGPVATVHLFDEMGDALQICHSTKHGLAAYVFGPEDQSTMDFAGRIRTGSVKINGVSLRALAPEAPRPAWGISGLGEEGVAATYNFFQGARVVGFTR